MQPGRAPGAGQQTSSSISEEREHHSNEVPTSRHVGTRAVNEPSRSFYNHGEGLN